ncbi:MAG: PrsW family intramembrane metalloprotease [Clostridia bacterium]|nr:PrsW family intramembrane metalloprotease [Clostridia bacterium]
MLFAIPLLISALIYAAAALLPAYFLMRYIYRMDKVEKEPVRLLFSLVIMGVVAAAIASAAEGIGMKVLGSFVSPNSRAYVILLAFVVVGAVEEGAKFLLLRRRTWNELNFNYRFDGIVYAVFVSLGFAAIENVIYVLGYGLSVAPMRALLAVPGHMAFGVFMGVFYGRAKICDLRGDREGTKENLICAYLSATLLHGFYDACVMMGTTLSTIIFVAFVIVMYRWVRSLIKKESATDMPVM